MNTQTLLYIVSGLFLAFVMWDKAWPRLKPLFSKKSASTQAMIDLVAALENLPVSYRSQVDNTLGKTLEACERLVDKAAESSVLQSNILTKTTAALTDGIKEKVVIQTQSTAQLISSIDKLTEALNGDESTKMLAGTLKACEAIASATVELRDEIAAFGKIVRIDDKPYPESNIIQPPDRAADEKVATLLEAIARGRDFGSAMQEAKDLQDTKTMFSAVTMDPMGEPQS